MVWAVGRSKRQAAASLPLFTEQAAWEIVEKIPLTARLGQEKVKTRGVIYGPYWFAYFQNAAGKRCRVYVGTDDQRDAVLDAHAIARRELKAAEKAADSCVIPPELERLRKLEAIARPRGAPHLARTSGVVEVPILEVRQRPK